MLSCATCGNGQHLEIGQSGNPAGPTWRAECGGCGTSWDFDDELT